jgi:predicted ester cyclase
MSTEANKTVLKRIYEEVFNKGNLAAVGELHAAKFVLHGPGGMELNGSTEAKEYVRGFRAAFPDVCVTVENMVAEGDYVADRVSITGTHRGDWTGIAPTGKRVTITCNALSRFEEGKQAEVWEEFDMLSLMQQLGVIPPMVQAGT